MKYEGVGLVTETIGNRSLSSADGAPASSATESTSAMMTLPGVLVERSSVTFPSQNRLAPHAGSLEATEKAKARDVAGDAVSEKGASAAAALDRRAVLSRKVVGSTAPAEQATHARANKRSRREKSSRCPPPALAA